MLSPLADRIRPDKIEDVFGQEHLLGEGKMLRNAITLKNIPNMIFYGPSGTGKTTVANIAARACGKKLYKLNATTASVSDIREITKELDTFGGLNGVLLYLDEIQNFNKKQQQSLLEFIENGKITLIASTTENPYFYVYNAILSRCTVFEFKPVSVDAAARAIVRGIDILKKELSPVKLTVKKDAVLHIANVSGGDIRKALNALELSVIGTKPNDKNTILVTKETAEECTQKKAMRYDRDGDSHYDILSAFQKSIRGSDPDAAIHYLARLVLSGDLISICRRLMVIASEDIGLAYPQAASIVKACVDSAFQLGFPEARIPLAQAVLLLANAPKSNSAVVAIDEAIYDINTKNVGDVPNDIKDGHYSGAEKLGRAKGYKYPHSYPNSYVKQQYLPDNIKDRVYYKYGDNKIEQGFKKYWDEIKEK